MDATRVVWVTGGSRGVGKRIAERFAAEGYAVVITARDPERLAKAAAAVRAVATAEVLWQVASIQNDQEIAAVVDLIRNRWNRLDALVCNAGISPVYTPSESLCMRDWSQIIDTNLTGVFRCCRHAVALMGDGGSIVNVSSIHGQAAAPNLVAYSASKGGVDALTRTLAVEWAQRGIRVNAVAPGYVETDMTAGLRNHQRHRAGLLAQIPLGRFGLVDDVAGMVVTLCSPQSSYITGTITTIDGGWTAR